MKRSRIISLIFALIIAVSMLAFMASCDLGVGTATCNHTYGEWITEKEATCTEAGSKYKTCTACGDKQTEAIAKLGHTGGTATCTEAAVCTACKQAYGDVDSSNHANEDMTYTVNAQASEKHDKKHACCGALIESENHIWDNGTPDTEVQGVTVYKCTKCNATDKKGSPETGHTHTASYVAASAADCTSAGNIEYWYCAGCDTRFSDEALTTEVSVTDSTISAAHTSNEFVYTVNSSDSTKHDKKYACCGELKSTDDHEYEVAGTTPVSCISDGSKTLKCKHCDAQTQETVQTKYGHSVDIWYFDSETKVTGKTCEYDQVFVGECSRCGEDATKTVKSVRHEMVATVKTAAKCNGSGEKTYACIHGCADTSYDKPYTDTNAHKWDAGVTEGGITTYTCEHCGGTKTAVVYSTTEATVNKSTLASHEVSLSGISLKLDSTTLGLVNDGDVLLEANTLLDTEKETLASNPNLPEAVQNLIRTGVVYDFGIKQGETYISDFEGGTVTVTIPYTPTGSDVDLIAVCYVGKNGEVEVVGGTYANGHITFKASHFSAYIPAEVSAEEACTVYGHNYSSVVTPATCTERGHTTKNCDRCGASVVTDVAYELGHILINGVETPATCTAEGKIVYTCTRDGCGDSVEVKIAKTSHDYRNDSENSKTATCTEDGYTIKKCSVCGHTQRTDYEAFGHDINEWSRAEYALAQGSKKCTDGIIETRYCSNEGCNYSEVMPIRYEHISLLDKMMDSEDYPELSENKITINIFDYAEYDYASNPMASGRAAPYITIMPACLCGELTGSVELNTGDFMMDMFFCDAVSYSDGTYVSALNGSEFWDPMTQSAPADFNVVFVVRTVKDVCHYQKYVDIYIGGDTEGNDAAYEMTVLLQEYDSHILAERAELLDPTLSCFESGLLNNYQGILVTEYCSECETVLREYGRSVSSDSSHYFIPTGTSYEYSIKVSNRNHIIRFTLRRCPCDTFEVYFYKSWCSFSNIETATIDGNQVKVYKCSDCGFMYGICEIEDTSNCRHKKTVIYYTDLEGADGVYTYDKKMTYEAFNYETLYTHLNKETVKTDIPTSDPCVHKYEQVITCQDCQKELSRNVYTEWVHDINETVTYDEHGNVITNTTCKRDGCVHHNSVTRDKNGNVIRNYIISRDYNGEYIEKWLTICAEINGMFYPTFERRETYDAEENLISWEQSVYAKSYDSKYERCILLGRHSSSDGRYYETEMEICVYSDEYVSQMGSCTQEGYDYTYCLYCGKKSYSYRSYAYGHEYSHMGTDDQGNSIYYCNRCGTDLPLSYLAVDIERLTYIEEQKNDGNIYIGYYNRNGMDSDGGIRASVSLIVAEFDASGKEITKETVLSVTVTDDGISKLYFSEAKFEAAIATLDYNESSDVTWSGMLKVVMDDYSDQVWYFKLV